MKAQVPDFKKRLSAIFVQYLILRSL